MRAISTRPCALRTPAARLVAAIESGAAASDPALLSPFLLVSYPDLKQYSFLYWCALLIWSSAQSLRRAFTVSQCIL